MTTSYNLIADVPQEITRSSSKVDVPRLGPGINIILWSKTRISGDPRACPEDLVPRKRCKVDMDPNVKCVILQDAATVPSHSIQSGASMPVMIDHIA